MSQRKTTNPHDSERRKQVRRRKSPQGSETEEVSGAIYRGGTPESQVNTLAQLSRPQQQTAIHNIGKIQGNRRAAQVVAHLQRHPGHDSLNPEQEQTVDGLAANLQRQISPIIMRAETYHSPQSSIAVMVPVHVASPLPPWPARDNRCSLFWTKRPRKLCCNQSQLSIL